MYITLKQTGILFCLLFAAFFGFSQEQKKSSNSDASVEKILASASEALDSLDLKKTANFLSLAKASIDSSSSDEVLFKYHQNIGFLAFEQNNITEALQGFEKSIFFAEKIQDTAAMASAYSGMANALLLDRRYIKALKYQEDALDLVREEKGKKYYSLLNNMAIAYTQAGENEKALRSYMEVKTFTEKNNISGLLAITENNIGELYREHFKDYSQAKQHYHRALKINFKNNYLQQLSTNYHNLALLYTATNNLDSSYHYIYKAIDLHEQIGDEGNLASSFTALGDIQLESNNPDTAIESFQKALRISREYGITPGLFYANKGIGEAYQKKGNSTLALKHFTRALEASEQSESLDLKGGILQTLFNFHKERKDYQKALLFSEKLKALEDSIADFKTNEKLDELRIQYETNLAKTENQVLKEKEAQQQQKIKWQAIFLVLLVVALAVVVLFIFFLLRGFKQRRETYKKLSKTSKELEQQYENIKKQEAELKRTVALKDKIFSVLGHDLRTPLANIIGLIDSISQIELSPEEMEYMLKHLKGETNNSLKTLENILQWARLQMNDQAIRPQELDEDGIIIEIIKNYEPNTEAKRIDIRYVNDSSSILWADENQFRSIASNLIGNAVKFSPVDGEIKVLFSEDPENFIFQVSDQGKGIDPKIIKNLETKEQLMSTYGTEGEKGTGIGLRIVKDFVAMHSGKLTFSANKPTGTIITVRFPKKHTKG